MPLLGFTVFKEKILRGLAGEPDGKRQTIRMLRKYPIEVGDRLYLYWKLRTKQCEKLGEATCTEHFLIYMGKEVSENKTTYRLMKQVNGAWVCVSTTEWVEIAKRDGFESDLEMFQWFDKRMDSVFEVIRWGNLSQKKGASA